MARKQVGEADSSPRGITTLEGPASVRVDDAPRELELGLLIVWSEHESDRLGEVLFPGADPVWFGRDVAGAKSQAQLVRQRPGRNEVARPLDNPFLSRRHLRIERGEDDTLVVHCSGRRRLRVNETAFEQLEVRRGDVFDLHGLYAFLCVERPRCIERVELPGAWHDFGASDAHGIVGESPSVWQLRASIAFAASRAAHVLITGPSGTGKELVACAIHSGSIRRREALISRNAATLPSGLIDAELFGNLRNYPNPGMPERPGLIGQAEGSSLFLDEIGELPAELQAHLLRVLDSGEYQRLGDARPRTADFRFLAATNRSASELKADLAARLALRIQVPGLGERPEDIPLLARHLVSRIAAKDPPIGERYLRGWNGHGGDPRISPALTRALVLHDYSTHVRELDGLLWRSLQSSAGNVLELTDEVRAVIRERAPTGPARQVSPVELRAALARHAGVKDRVWRELGLSSRHALLRLMRKLGVT